MRADTNREPGTWTSGVHAGVIRHDGDGDQPVTDPQLARQVVAALVGVPVDEKHFEVLDPDAGIVWMSVPPDDLAAVLLSGRVWTDERGQFSVEAFGV